MFYFYFVFGFHRVQELKEQIDTLNAQNKSTIQGLSCQLREVKNALEEQCQLTEEEAQAKKASEMALIQSQNTIEELKAKLVEIENSRPNPGTYKKIFA